MTAISDNRLQTLLFRVQHVIIHDIDIAAWILSCLTEGTSEGELANSLKQLVEAAANASSESEGKAFVLHALEIAESLADRSNLVGALGCLICGTVRRLFSPEWVGELTGSELEKYDAALDTAREILGRIDSPPKDMKAAAFIQLKDRYHQDDYARYQLAIRRLLELIDSTPVGPVEIGLIAEQFDFRSRLPKFKRSERSFIFLRMLRKFHEQEKTSYALQVELKIWKLLVECAPYDITCESYLKIIEFLKRRTVSLLGAVVSEDLRNSGSNPGGSRYVSLSEMVLLAADGMMVVWRYEQAREWLRVIRQEPGWDIMVASAGGEELDAILAALEADEIEAMPPVSLLQDLIAAKCSRAAIYLVLLWCFQADRATWPSHSVISCIDIAFKACIATWNKTLARAFFIYLEGLLSVDWKVALVADQAGDLAPIKGMFASLKKNGCDVMFDEMSDWRDLIR